MSTMRATDRQTLNPPLHVPRMLFPTRPVRPLRSLTRRVGLSIGIWLLVAVITWLGRDGYRDVDGSHVTMLGAIYYASVSVTTTGYGDITPVSSTARLITSIVVTPARILFLIILVGTTIEVLTERFRESLAVSSWRKRVQDHLIVVGYGTKGRGAVDSMIANGVVSPADIVAIDTDARVLEDLLVAGRGLELAERPAETTELGGPPHRNGGGTLPVAIVRRGERIAFDDARFSILEAGDVIVSLHTDTE